MPAHPLAIASFLANGHPRFTHEFISGTVLHKLIMQLATVEVPVDTWVYRRGRVATSFTLIIQGQMEVRSLCVN